MQISNALRNWSLVFDYFSPLQPLFSLQRPPTVPGSFPTFPNAPSPTSQKHPACTTQSIFDSLVFVRGPRRLYHSTYTDSRKPEVWSGVGLWHDYDTRDCFTVNMRGFKTCAIRTERMDSKVRPDNSRSTLNSTFCNKIGTSGLCTLITSKVLASL